ncbi:MAG: hypothetical protein GWN00_21125 [Aliifodinibius sp.]|nr:hypothetical protein [Fodinibius sp.]NIY27217.1 hypothetical protein [Fodinibius sp.]
MRYNNSGHNDAVFGVDGGDGNKGRWSGFTYQWGDPSGAYALDNNDLYYRRFQNGWVFVNPSDTAQTSTVLSANDCYQKFQDSTSGTSQNWQGLSAQQCDDLQVGAYSAEFLWSPDTGSTHSVSSVRLQ